MTEKRQQSNKRNIKQIVWVKGFLAMCLLAVTLFAFQYEARAEEYLLSSNGKTVFIGETFAISDYFDQEKFGQIVQESLQYAVLNEDKGTNADCIELTPDGKVTALKEGKVMVSVTYQQTAEDSEPRAEVFEITVIQSESVTAVYGQKIWLTAFNMYSPYTYDELPENGDAASPKYVYTFSESSVALDDGGDGLVVQGFKDASVYLEKDSAKILVAEITVKVPKFKKSRMARATETSAFYPELENCTLESYPDDGEEVIYSIEPAWGVEDQKIVELSESGFLAAAKGSTKITAAFKAKNGDELTLTITITVTNPKLTGDMVVLATGVTKKLPISGACSDSTYLVGGSPADDRYDEDDEISGEFGHAYLLSSGKIRGKSQGKEKAVVDVDGRELTITLVVTDPRYENNTFTLYKGLVKTLPIKGLNKQYSTISYTSKDTSIAKVTSTGEVTAKKVGTVKIQIKADGRSFIVWVEISTKKAYQAAKKEIAISKTKTQYSQIKRMSKGYYDCSSLVSRVYRQFGVYFGSKSGWSPTAAGIGQWCTTHNKVISKKAVPYTKLVPGDLIFYSYTKNGRYRNISHIEMYVGNGMNVSASSSRNAVVHYGYSTNCTVLVARPLR